MAGTPYFRDNFALEERLSVTGSLDVWVEFPGPDHGSSVLEVQARAGGQVLPGAGDQIRFFSFRSIVIALGGETNKPADPAPAGQGLFDIAIRLYDRAYDVHMYDEDYVSPVPLFLGSGRPYDEVVSAVRYREVTQVAIFGYSHGGGKTYWLANRLTSNAAQIGSFTIPYTAYIDAVATDWFLRETDLPPVPPGSNRQHSNYYQRHLLLRGDSIPTSVPDRDHSATEVHGTIDDEELVKQGTEGIVVQLVRKVLPR